MEEKARYHADEKRKATKRRNKRQEMEELVAADCVACHNLGIVYKGKRFWIFDKFEPCPRCGEAQMRVATGNYEDEPLLFSVDDVKGMLLVPLAIGVPPAGKRASADPESAGR